LRKFALVSWNYWIQEFYKLTFPEFDISPRILTQLARILLRCPSKPQISLGRDLLMSASAASEPTATFEIISSAITHNGIHRTNISNARQHLSCLANDGQMPEAMILMGKMYESQNQHMDALAWYQKAVNMPRDPATTLSFQIPGLNISTALVSIGRIAYKTNKPEAAERAFKEAALEYDSPHGYYYLSQLPSCPPESKEVYLLKAATSGIFEACHDLGRLAYAKSREAPAKQKKEHLGMAKEWFRVAADSGQGLAMLKLALICKVEGDDTSGLKWIERAETTGAQEQAIKVRLQWGDSRLDAVGGILS
jgi:TPR repeat protein